MTVFYLLLGCICLRGAFAATQPRLPYENQNIGHRDSTNFAESEKQFDNFIKLTGTLPNVQSKKIYWNKEWTSTTQPTTPTTTRPTIPPTNLTITPSSNLWSYLVNIVQNNGEHYNSIQQSKIINKITFFATKKQPTTPPTTQPTTPPTTQPTTPPTTQPTTPPTTQPTTAPTTQPTTQPTTPPTTRPTTQPTTPSTTRPSTPPTTQSTTPPTTQPTTPPTNLTKTPPSNLWSYLVNIVQSNGEHYNSTQQSNIINSITFFRTKKGNPEED